MMIADRRRAVENDRNQPVLIGLRQTIHQFLECPFHGLPVAGCAPASRIAAAKTAEAPAAGAAERAAQELAQNQARQ